MLGLASSPQLADRGHGLEVIAELAGHADVRTTKGYVHVSAQRRAVAVHDTFGPSTEAAHRPLTF